MFLILSILYSFISIIKFQIWGSIPCGPCLALFGTRESVSRFRTNFTRALTGNRGTVTLMFLSVKAYAGQFNLKYQWYMLNVIITVFAIVNVVINVVS